MSAYRLYYFDGVGRIAAARDLESETDQSALVMAGRYKTGQAMEIWREDRFVGCIPGRPTSEPASSAVHLVR